MKKLLPLLSVFSAILLFSCRPTENEPPKPSLQLGETTLMFAASGNPSQTVSVTSNVEWSVSVASTASEWLHATKTDDGTITVTVDDNSAGQRVGIIKVTADGSKVIPKNITVTQAEETMPDFTLTVEPAAMTFEGEGAEPQTATVTVNDPQLKWSAAPEDALKEWVTVSAADDKLTVSVSDNPGTEQRAGNIIITPSMESASPKAIRIIQEGRILPSSIEVSEKELRFGPYKGIGQSVVVTAVNVDWDAEVLSEEGVDTSWIELSVTKNENTSSLTVNVKTNPLLEERTGYIVVKPTDDALDDIQITVIQEAGVEHLSNLNGNLFMEDIVVGVSNDVFFTPNQLWHDRDYATWDIQLWGPEVERTKDRMGYWHYSGQGTRLYLEFCSERVVYNDDGVYELPSGDYTVSDAAEILPGTLKCGLLTNNFSTPNGSWYMEVDGENDTFRWKAPLLGGKVTVSRSGEDYTFVFDLLDDIGYTIAGSCVTKLDNIRVNYHERPDPNKKPTPSPEEPTEPEVPSNPDDPRPYRR